MYQYWAFAYPVPSVIDVFPAPLDMTLDVFGMPATLHAIVWPGLAASSTGSTSSNMAQLAEGVYCKHEGASSSFHRFHGV